MRGEDLIKEYLKLSAKKRKLTEDIIKKADNLTKKYPEKIIEVHGRYLTKEITAQEYTGKINYITEAIDIIRKLETPQDNE